MRHRFYNRRIFNQIKHFFFEFNESDAKFTQFFQKHIHAVSCSLFAERKIVNFEILLQQRMSDSIVLLYFHVNLMQSKGKC